MANHLGSLLGHMHLTESGYAYAKKENRFFSILPPCPLFLSQLGRAGGPEHLMVHMHSMCIYNNIIVNSHHMIIYNVIHVGQMHKCGLNRQTSPQ